MPTVLTPYRIPGPRPSLKSRLLVAAGAFFAMLLLVTAAEFSLRLLGFTWISQSEPVAGKPGLMYEGKGRGPFRTGAVRTNNSLGHRAPEPAQFGCAHPVVALGDSYTKGSQLPDGASWPEQLEARLKASGVCVYNAGVGGTGLPEQRAELEKLLAAGVKPEAVVHLFFFDDFYQGTDSGFEQKARSAPLLFILQGLTLSTIRLHLHLAWEHPWVREHLPPVDFRAVWTDAEHARLERRYTELWQEWAAWLSERGIRQATGMLGYYSSMLKGRAPELADLEAAHRARSVPYHVFTLEDLPQDPMLWNDGHFDAAAYGRIAARMEPLVRELVMEVKKE